jgi:cold-inducible RNA-binding protein
MEKNLYITPPSLLRWQPKGERKDVMFLDLEPDFLGENTIRLDLNIVFRPIALKQGWVDKADFYIGSTGARVGFEATGGQVKNYTRGTPLQVDHEKTYRRSRESAVNILPGITIGTNVKADLGTVSFRKETESTFTAKFSGSELALTDTFLGDGVEWEFVPPAGQVIHDYLAGNLHLYVEAFWNGDAKEGRIELRPSDVRFFNSERQIIGSKMHKTWLMLYTLFRRKEGRGINSEPTIISFKEIRVMADDEIEMAADEIEMDDSPLTTFSELASANERLQFLRVNDNYEIEIDDSTFRMLSAIANAKDDPQSLLELADIDRIEFREFLSNCGGTKNEDALELLRVPEQNHLSKKYGLPNRKSAGKLYVGNLSFHTSSEDLQQLFAQAGRVESANVVEDRHTGRSRGFGFVEMSTREESEAAIQQFNGKELNGRSLRVNEASPKEDRAGPRHRSRA